MEGSSKEGAGGRFPKNTLRNRNNTPYQRSTQSSNPNISPELTRARADIAKATADGENSWIYKSADFLGTRFENFLDYMLPGDRAGPQSTCDVAVTRIKNSNLTKEEYRHLLKVLESCEIKEPQQTGVAMPMPMHTSTPAATSHRSVPGSTCFLHNFKDMPVALGVYDTADAHTEHAYHVIVEQVIDKNAELYDGSGRLGDVRRGQAIYWPKASVKSYWQ